MPSCLRSSFLTVLLGLLALALLSSCGVRQLAQGEIQPPKVDFQGISLGQPTPQGWPVGVRLLLQNPNPQALNLLGYNCQLWIEGKSVAQVENGQPINLPPQGQTLAEVPIMVQLPAVMGLLPQFLPQFLGQQQQQQQMLQRKLHYQVAGSFRLASVMGGIIPIPFRFQGEASPQQGMDFLKPYLH